MNSGAQKNIETGVKKCSIYQSINRAIAASAVVSVTMCTAIAGSTAFAFDSADVLPEHVNSSMVRVGMVTGIDERYDGNGNLETLGDMHSMQFNSAALVQINPQAQQLISALNQFGNQQLGTELNLGILKVNTDPQINYIAPIQAYGVTSKFTIAVGLPIMQYHNDVTLSQTGGNVSQIQSQVNGVGSAALNSAFQKLNVSLVQSAQQLLAQEGYEPLGETNQTIVGDLQVAGLYQFYKKDNTSLLSKTILTLPTGPAPDPNNIADPGLTGNTAITEEGIVNYRLLPKLKLSAKIAYEYMIPDKVQERVPTSAQDTLPAQNTIETVNRKTGDTVTEAFGANYQLARRWTTGVGYEFDQIGADQYSGSQGSNYALLATDTGGSAQVASLNVSYDSLSAFLAKETFLPTVITYSFSDTVAGVNVPRQTINELWITMFF
jgi:hypothetical protein